MPRANNPRGAGTARNNEQAEIWLKESRGRLHVEKFLKNREMTREARRRKWRWLRHVVWVLAAKVLLILLILAGVAIFFGSGAGNPLIHGFCR